MLEEHQSNQPQVSAKNSESLKKAFGPGLAGSQDILFGEARAASPPICESLDTEATKYLSESILHHLLPPPPQFRKPTQTVYVPISCFSLNKSVSMSSGKYTMPHFHIAFRRQETGRRGLLGNLDVERLNPRPLSSFFQRLQRENPSLFASANTAEEAAAASGSSSNSPSSGNYASVVRVRRRTAWRGKGLLWL